MEGSSFFLHFLDPENMELFYRETHPKFGRHILMQRHCISKDLELIIFLKQVLPNTQ